MNKSKDELRATRGSEIKQIKSYKGKISDDVIYQSEKEIHDLYLAAVKKLENMQKEKEQQVNKR